MAGRWDTWLRELASAMKGGIRLPAASRGRLYELAINLPGDFTGATMRAEVHSAPDAAPVLATFAVTGPVVAAGVSTFTFTLAAGTGANSTGVLPGDDDIDGVEEFPVDFLLNPAGADPEELLFGAVLPLTGRVTV
jgi:hypothetical protein